MLALWINASEVTAQKTVVQLGDMTCANEIKGLLQQQDNGRVQDTMD